MKRKVITVQTRVSAPVEKVWEYWNDPEHICRWNSPSEGWYTSRAENHLQVQGKFSYRMEARDGSDGFDFEGKYDQVETYKNIAYTMEDGRKVRVQFVPEGDAILVEENFEAEATHPVEMQREGWQAILENFRKYVES